MKQLVVGGAFVDGRAVPPLNSALAKHEWSNTLAAGSSAVSYDRNRYREFDRTVRGA